MFADQVRIRSEGLPRSTPPTCGFQASAVGRARGLLLPRHPRLGRGRDRGGDRYRHDRVQARGRGHRLRPRGRPALRLLRRTDRRRASPARTQTREPRLGPGGGAAAGGIDRVPGRGPRARRPRRRDGTGARRGRRRGASGRADRRGSRRLGNRYRVRVRITTTCGPLALQPVAYGDGLADRVRALAPAGSRCCPWTPPAAAPSRSRGASAPPTYAPPPSPTQTNTPGPSRSSPTWTKPTWKPLSSWPRPGSCRSA